MKDLSLSLEMEKNLPPPSSKNGYPKNFSHLKKKLKKRLRSMDKSIAKLCLCFCLGFCFSRGRVFSLISPLGCSFLASVSSSYVLPSFLGATLGYLLSGHQAIKYISSSIIIGASKWLFSFLSEDRKYKNLDRLASPLMAFLGIFLSSITISSVFGLKSYDILLGASEGLIASSVCYFFHSAKEALKNGQALYPLKDSLELGAISSLSHGEIISVFLSSFALVLSLFSLRLLDLSLGRIAIGVLIIGASCLFFEAGGAILGVSSALCLFMGETSSADFYLAWSYILGGILVGAFARLSKSSASLVYALVGILTRLVSSISSAEISPSFNPAYDMLISSAICLLIPSSFYKRLRLFLRPKGEENNSSSIKTLMLGKLYDARLALLDISKDARAVSQKLSKISSASLTDVYSSAISSVCKNCKNYHLCLSLSYSEVMDCFNNLSLPLKQRGFISEADFTYPLKSRCCQKERLSQTIDSEYKSLTESAKKLREVSKIREVVLDQFETLGDMLGGFVKELSELTREDNALKEKLRSYLLSLGIEKAELSVFRTTDERIWADIYIDSLKLIYLKNRPFKSELEEIFGVPLEAPQISSLEEKTKISLWEKSEFSCKFAFAQHKAKGEKLCGDSFLVMNEKRASAYVILSDGMGTGYNAAVDSAMTVSLIKKLILAGVSFDASLRAANGALLVLSIEESLSTVDIARIDIFSVNVSFYKAGSAPSFVKKDGKVSKINSSSLPIGILSGVSFEKSFSKIKEGDILLMVSDGATFLGDEWIENALSCFEGDNLQELCDDILVTARLKSQKLKEDDITVIAVRLVRA